MQKDAIQVCTKPKVYWIWLTQCVTCGIDNGELHPRVMRLWIRFSRARRLKGASGDRMNGIYRVKIYLFVLGAVFVSAACVLSGKPAPTASPASSVPRLTPALTQPGPVETSRPMSETQAPTPGTGTLTVAYTSQNDVYLWSRGAAKRLTTSGDAYEPRLSPDGKTIAYLRTVDAFHLELWAIETDGTRQRPLVSVDDLDAIGGGVRDPAALAINPYRFRWVPESRSLAFNTQQVFQGPGLSLLNDLNLVDADSLQITNLLLSGWGGEFCYSPDGSQIAISQPDQIILANADGSRYRSVLSYDPVTTYSEYRFYAMPVWSPDGDYLMAAIPPVDPLAEPPQATEIWRISTDDTPALLAGRVQAVPFQEQPVAFSPDLKRIAFLRETGQPQENLRELHLATIDGQGDFIYSKASPIIFQSWSTDGVRFAYSTGLTPETWIGSLDGSPLGLNPDFNGAQGLRWVNGEQFLFWVRAGNAFELYLAEVDGGSQLLDTVFGTMPFFTFLP